MDVVKWRVVDDVHGLTHVQNFCSDCTTRREVRLLANMSVQHR